MRSSPALLLVIVAAGCGRISFDRIGPADADADVSPPGVCGARTEPTLAMGAETTCLVRLDGTLWCAGTGYGDQFRQVGSATNWLRVDGEETSFCALDTACGLWCWGANVNGELAVGDMNDCSAPTRVTPGTIYRDVGAGGFHTCAIRDDNLLFCAGRAQEGELGLGDFGPDRTVLTQVGSLTWRTIARGYLFTCALDTSDRLWCWGANDEGQLGQGDFGAGTERSSPVLVSAVSHQNDWAAVGTGKEHACVIGKDRQLWCWGANQTGQVGRGDLLPEQTIPFEVGGSSWDRLAIGRFMSCATEVDRSLSCWGDNAQGSVGVPSSGMVPLPAKIPTPAGWSAVSPMNIAACAFDTTGELYCWGGNDFGQLGLGDVADRPTPTHVALP